MLSLLGSRGCSHRPDSPKQPSEVLGLRTENDLVNLEDLLSRTNSHIG